MTQNAQNTVSTFTLPPGKGYLFLQGQAIETPTKTEAKKGIEYFTALWQGHVRLTDDLGGRLQVRARVSSRPKSQYVVQLVEFDTWKTVAEFEMPKLGDIGMSETKLELGNKRLTFRLFRAENGVRISIPEIVSGDRARAAAL